MVMIICYHCCTGQRIWRFWTATIYAAETVILHEADTLIVCVHNKNRNIFIETW